MYKKFYSRFLEAHKGQFHFACHSHHYWPDVTLEAMQEFWYDSCKYVDDKWEYFFSEEIPSVQKLVGEILNVDAKQIVFAPNTHELVFRILSCFPRTQKVKVLTTNSEFYSFDRQIRRTKEEGLLNLIQVPTEPYKTFEDRFIEEIKKEKPDFVFFSHVFFNSGFACDFERIARACPATSVVCIDGYHGFMALPTSLKDLNVFYVAGSYKYAQGGEGCCFLVVPQKCQLRPEYTGWFAELGQIQNYSGHVGYPEGSGRFWGSTMDFTALYRLHSVLKLFQQEKISVQVIHDYVLSLQHNFLHKLKEIDHRDLNLSHLEGLFPEKQGHFFAFDLKSPERMHEVQKRLRSKGIITDGRGTKLRFGFGLYHEPDYDLRAIKEI